MAGNLYTADSKVVGKENPLPTEGSNGIDAWTILNGTNISTSYVDLGGKTLVALNIPSGYAGGNITFQASDNATGTYNDVYDVNSVLITATVAGASRVVALTGTVLQAMSSLRYIKIKTSSNVTADRVIGLISKG